MFTPCTGWIERDVSLEGARWNLTLQGCVAPVIARNGFCDEAIGWGGWEIATISKER